VEEKMGRQNVLRTFIHDFSTLLELEVSGDVR
jgi:hypothetical protein